MKNAIIAISLIIVLCFGVAGAVYMYEDIPVTYDGQERNMTLTFAPNYSSFASNGAFLIRRMLFNVIISSVSLEGVFNNQAINEILEPRLIRQ